MKKFLQRKRLSNSPYTVIRMSREGHHFYSILAWESGFEFVFRNGHERWSTVSPNFAKRILQANTEGKVGSSIANSKMEFLEIASLGTSDSDSAWERSREISYESKDQALKIERAVLDESWQKNGVE